MNFVWERLWVCCTFRTGGCGRAYGWSRLCGVQVLWVRACVRGMLVARKIVLGSRREVFCE